MLLIRDAAVTVAHLVPHRGYQDVRGLPSVPLKTCSYDLDQWSHRSRFDRRQLSLQVPKDDDTAVDELFAALKGL